MLLMIIKIILFLSILATVLFYILYREEKKLKNEEQGEKSITERLNIYLGRTKDGDGSTKIFSYESIEKFLKRTGNANKLNPVSFILVKIIIAISCSVLVYSFLVPKLAIVGGIVGFFIFDFLIIRQDKKETKIIEFEFKDIYENLTLQTAGGVYIGQALAECYTVVSNKRFKKSLALMAATIWKTSSIEQALKDFSERFKSPGVNNFVLVILQSLETGKIKEQLRDQSEKMNGLSAINLKENTLKINDEIKTLGFLLFMGIFGIVIYYCIMIITKTGVSMFT